ncbi:MAG: chromosome segregation protein SMC [Nitrospiraceae bacterium]|nr:MAG: chromosome segregation protein SMC [Nitrospiraceae bacterium]
MRIERLELNGFKSFADKTVFKYHPGTTAIVGPNGCGKSNIVDAFKWVLGEQSAKSLRGGSMEDVIFAGSASKKTKGMAEVTLVLSDIISNQTTGPDGEVRKMPSEISVTRRLYRSGESEYLMNKVPCRLKDIKNMFLDTGLELKAYSILEQGRIGDIVNSKPIDRRFLIEEVAGVMKYKVRKQEATNKLEASKSNLQRLQDIIAEVKRQINTIDRHARKAEKYKKLFEEIKDIEIRTARRDLKAFQEEIVNLVSSEEALKLNDAEVSINFHSMEALIEEKKRLCIDNERSLAEIRNRLYALEKETMEDEGKIALLKSDCENLRERNGHLLRQSNDLTIEKETTLESIKEIENSEVEMARDITGLEAILDERKEIFSAAENAISEIEKELEHERRNLYTRAEELSNIKNEISHLTLNIDNITRKKERSSREINSVQDSMSSLVMAIEQTKNEDARFEEELQETRQAREGHVTRLKEKKTELALSEESLYAERESLAAMVSRHESLVEIDRSQMASLDENIRTLCQVADIIETPSEYEAAFEAILGDKLGASIVNDQGEISRALGYIKEQNAKRSGFITVNPETDAVSEGTNAYLSHSGVIGEALKFVSVKEGFDKVAAALLTDVILVDNLDTAFSLREHPDTGIKRRSMYIVTLGGEVLEPSGIVFGGTDKGVLKIKRQIKEIENELASKRLKISEAESSVAGIREEIISTENEIISLDGKISSQEKYSHGLKLKTENLEEEKARLQQKHEYISLEITDDHREIDNLGNMLAQKQQHYKNLEEEKLLNEEKIRSVQNAITEKRESLETTRYELTEVKLELTSVREKMASVKREIDRLQTALIEIDRKQEEMSNERGNIQEVIGQKEQQVVQKEETLKLKIVAVSELQSEAARVNEILEAKKAELELMEKQQKDLARQLEAIHTELSHVEMKKMERSMKLDYLKEDIHKTYAVEIESADVPDTVTAEEEERLPGLKSRLQEIGPVSLGTLDEYEELKGRFEFLTKQRDDLLSAIADLEDTIQKINRTSKKRLEDAFEALNEKFKEVFTILFGKGRAELQLTEGSILDAGIEIIAQPPGKRLQNLTLLSGGEKALTALSLLFAGFMIKPTPLCLLDEVDAPLDESNTERFINLLREMAKNIQFIAITHNRRTMEAADYIYGITMEEPGASKVVSMQLSEAV